MDTIAKTKAKQGFGTTTGGATSNRVYEDFEPHMEWAREETNFDTLLVYLPGFQKDKLNIQITSGGKLRLIGERVMEQNKWRRFHKELPLAPDCDSNKITAKFEGGILYVKVPKSPNINPIVKDHEKPKPTPKPMSTTTPSDQPIPASHPDKKPSNTKVDSKETPEKDSKTSTTSSANISKIAVQATSTGDVPGKPMTRLETYKKKFVQRLGSDRVAKSPRALLNIILAVLFIGVLGLYIKNAFKSVVHSNSSDEL